MSFSAILDNNFMPELLDKAIVQIKKDRDNYSHVYKIIEQYCKQYELIISNLYILLDQKDNSENTYNKMYKVYTSNPFKHTNDLTNLIHKESTEEERKFTKLKTIKEQEEFCIEYDTRIVITMYKIQRFKSKSQYHEPNAVIKPVKINNLLYLPSEIEIIDIYHTLYDISKFKEWDKSSKFEEILFLQFKDRYNKGILGGYDNSCKNKKKDFLESLKISIVKDWLPEQNNIILIGSWAYNWILLGEDICSDNDKIQFISLMNCRELLASMQRYISNFSKFQISMREQELHIPKDFRMNRYTYYLHMVTERGTIEKPFLDLFNCAEFEIIPYSKIKSNTNITLYIGNKYVMLRFLFIDLWIIRLIETMGLISKDVLQKKMQKIISQCEKIRNTIGDKLIDGNFMGVFKNYEIAKKIEMLSGKRFTPYYPHLYYKDNKSYRDIR